MRTLVRACGNGDLKPQDAHGKTWLSPCFLSKTSLAGSVAGGLRILPPLSPGVDQLQHDVDDRQNRRRIDGLRVGIDIAGRRDRVILRPGAIEYPREFVEAFVEVGLEIGVLGRLGANGLSGLPNTSACSGPWMFHTRLANRSRFSTTWPARKMSIAA